jgi:acyl-CoA synthetase (AMP-forming)/AMP-acid ligase II
VLLEYAAGLLAPYKRPCEVIAIGTLPTAANGKVLKNRLAQMARGREAVPTSPSGPAVR